MARPFISACLRQLRSIGRLVGGILFLLAVPSSASSQSTNSTSAQLINPKVVKFLSSNVGKKVGSGQSADAVTEALRSAGGAFTETDLGSDFPEQGDRMWGTPVKVLSFKNGILADSNPSDAVRPGDVLQYKKTTFVYVTNTGRKTTTTTVSAIQHTSVAARVNSKTNLPVKVYEQNAPAAPNVDTRKIALNSIDFDAMRAGWVFIYRPKSRIDDPVKYQISIVNNTSSTKVPVLKSGLKTVVRVSLDPSNSPASFTAIWANATTAKTGLSLVLPNGESIGVKNAASYEIYQRTNGLTAIRLVTP